MHQNPNLAIFFLTLPVSLYDQKVESLNLLVINSLSKL